MVKQNVIQKLTMNNFHLRHFDSKKIKSYPIVHMLSDFNPRICSSVDTLALEKSKRNRIVKQAKQKISWNLIRMCMHCI